MASEVLVKIQCLWIVASCRIANSHGMTYQKIPAMNMTSRPRRLESLELNTKQNPKKKKKKKKEKKKKKKKKKEKKKNVAIK